MTAQVRACGVMFSVETAGSGPPLVCIHGWSMSGRFFQRQLAGLSGHFGVIVPDLRGHGVSEKVLHDVRIVQPLSVLGRERSLQRRGRGLRRGAALTARLPLAQGR
jgi:pimeloyl-ACP methyl ester carboxylesterase